MLNENLMRLDSILNYYQYNNCRVNFESMRLYLNLPHYNNNKFRSIKEFFNNLGEIQGVFQTIDVGLESSQLKLFCTDCIDSTDIRKLFLDLENKGVNFYIHSNFWNNEKFKAEKIKLIDALVSNDEKSRQDERRKKFLQKLLSGRLVLPRKLTDLDEKFRLSGDNIDEIARNFSRYDSEIVGALKKYCVFDNAYKPYRLEDRIKSLETIDFFESQGLTIEDSFKNIQDLKKLKIFNEIGG